MVTPKAIPEKKRPGQPALLTFWQPGSRAELDIKQWIKAKSEMTTDFPVQDSCLKPRNC